MPGIPQQALQGLSNATGQILDAAGNPMQQPAAVRPQGEAGSQPGNQPAIDPRLADPNSETWMQKFQVIEGKYKGEVQPMAAKIRALEDENRRLNDVVTQTQHQVQKQSETQQPAALVGPGGLNKEETDFLDQEGLGTKVLSIVQKLVDERVRHIQQPFVQDVQKMQQESIQTQKTTAQQLHDDFFGEMDKQVPDWEAINADPRWKEWLMEKPLPSSPFTRDEAVKRAQDQRDVPTLVAIFNEFRSALNMTVQVQPLPGVQTMAVDPINQNLPVQAAPAIDSAALDANTKMWKKQEITQFYTDVTRGVYTPEQSSAIDAQIAYAAQQGRVER